MNLPILSYRQQIRDLVHSQKRLIVTAPPGTGKSTQIPQFFLDELTPQKRMYVLEPRRIAARMLAARVAQELGSECGEVVGYQVRFDRMVSAQTKIVFCTYGTFLQLLQSDPTVAECSIIVFDEFHERSLEADATLAWVRQLAARTRPDLLMMVLSATLDHGPLISYLDSKESLTIEDRLFPVDIVYQQPKPQEPLSAQVERAFTMLLPIPGQGSVLVFLPGSAEITHAEERLFEATRRHGYRLLRLHGSLPQREQQTVLSLPAQEPCCILATNIAETSLTIPGVTAVIDSGLARVASYDVDRDRNTLYVSRISRQNAAQRTGRAGRLTKGKCVRLWSKEDETTMAVSVVPEVLRLDLSRILLTLCSIASRPDKNAAAISNIEWLDPPPVARWDKARDELVRCRAVARDAKAEQQSPSPTFRLYPLSALGRNMGALPIDPPLARILLECRSDDELAQSIAMAAIWEATLPSRSGSMDLFTEAESLRADPHGTAWSREVIETKQQLTRILPGTGVQKEKSHGGLREQVTRAWVQSFSHRIASREGTGSLYLLPDGRGVRLDLKKRPSRQIEVPQIILALVIHERGGRGRALQNDVPFYVPVTLSLLKDVFPGECTITTECRWDEVKQRVLVEQVTQFKRIVLERVLLENRPLNRLMVKECLAQKLGEGLYDWKAIEPHAEQFVFRLKLARTAFPDIGIPAMTDEDWELIYHEAADGCRSLDDVKKRTMLDAIKSYIGQNLVSFIEKKAPEKLILPSGKKAVITYFEGTQPEISARLGDFIGYKERFVLLDGRIQGIFNILAPNYRTVQKTSDLGSFWKNSYPEIKNELKRKYPKHPWP